MVHIPQSISVSCWTPVLQFTPTNFQDWSEPHKVCCSLQSTIPVNPPVHSSALFTNVVHSSPRHWTRVDQSSSLTEVVSRLEWTRVNCWPCTIKQSGSWTKWNDRIGLWTGVDHEWEWTIDQSGLQCILDCGVELVCPRLTSLSPGSQGVRKRPLGDKLHLVCKKY